MDRSKTAKIGLSGRVVVVLALAALSVEIWMLLTNVHFLWKPPQGLLHRAKIAEVLSVADDVKVRSPYLLGWSPLLRGSALYEGDEIATLENGRVSLRFLDGQSVILGRNSLLVLERAKLLAERSFSLSLVRGKLTHESSREDVPGEKGSAQLEILVGDRRVVATRDTSLMIENPNEPGRGPTVRISGEGGKIQNTEETVPLFAALPGPVAQLKAPVLVWPEAASKVRKDGPVSLRWAANSVNASEAAVEIALDPQFKKIVWRQAVRNQSSADYRPDQQGVYYWRVVAGHGTGRVTSDARTFRVIDALARPVLFRPEIRGGVGSPIRIPAPLLKRPLIRYPGDEAGDVRDPEPTLMGLRASLRWLGQALIPDASAADGAGLNAVDAPKGRYAVDLSWLDVPGAKGYRIQIAADSEFIHPIVDRKVEREAFTWSADSPGRYYWRVAALDADAESGPFSEFMAFSFRAERNQVGDETTYDTYRRYDDYCGWDHRLRLLGGPSYSEFFMTSTAGKVKYAATELKNFQVNYEYRISPYYGGRFVLRDKRSLLRASVFEDLPRQHTLVQDEVGLTFLLERRWFKPSHYFFLTGGPGFSYIDVPVPSANSQQLTLSNYGFFGAQVSGGITVLLGRNWDATLEIGTSIQHSGDAFRAGQLAYLDFRWRLRSGVSVGARIDENVFYMNFLSSSDLNATGHSVTLWPMVFLGLDF